VRRSWHFRPLFSADKEGSANQSSDRRKLVDDDGDGDEVVGEAALHEMLTLRA